MTNIETTCNFRFEFNGPVKKGFAGLLVNENLEKKKLKRKNRFLSINPYQDFEAFTKKQLWKDVKEYVKNYRHGRTASITCNGKTYII